MKKLLVLIPAVLGALAFWRRDSLKDDVGKATEAVKIVPAKVKARAGVGDGEDVSESDAGGDEPEAPASDESASDDETSAAES